MEVPAVRPQLSLKAVEEPLGLVLQWLAACYAAGGLWIQKGIRKVEKGCSPFFFVLGKAARTMAEGWGTMFPSI